MTTETTKIWKEFHQELKAYVRKIIYNKSDTDDIMQEIFVKIICNIDKVNQAENMRQYLYVIARNTINDYFKQQHKNNKNEIPEIILEEDSQSLNSLIAEKLKPFINQLPNKYKEALLITEFQNISQKELATILNISYSGAKSRVQRGKEKLKEQLLDCCIFESDVYGNIIDLEVRNCNC